MPLTAPIRRPRGRPTAAASRASEQDLVRVAGELFGRDGFAGVSMGEVARRSGISKTTLYARYPDKPSLFRAICRYACRVPADAFREIVTADRAPRLVLADFAAAARAGMFNRDAADLLRLAIFEAQRFPDVAAAILKESRQVYAPLSAYLAELLAAGLIRNEPVLLADRFVTLMAGSYHDLLRPQPDARQSDAHVEAALEFFIRGIGLAC